MFLVAQTAGWIKMALSTEVGVGPGYNFNFNDPDLRVSKS